MAASNKFYNTQQIEFQIQILVLFFIFKKKWSALDQLLWYTVGKLVQQKLKAQKMKRRLARQSAGWGTQSQNLSSHLHIGLKKGK